MSETPALVLRDAVLSERDSAALREYIADEIARRSRPSIVVAQVCCPDCGDAIPIGAEVGEIRDGNLEIEPDLTDVWAHHFGCGEEATDR